MTNGLRSALAPFLLVITMTGIAAAQTPSIGAFDGHRNLGAVERSGWVSYDASRDEYVVAGPRTASATASHLVWKRLRGDFIVTARARFADTGANGAQRLGWMARSTLEPDAAYVALVVRRDGTVTLEHHRGGNAVATTQRLPVTEADVIQLERQGATYIVSAARFGDTLVSRSLATVDLGAEPYVALFVGGHAATPIERATFRDVRITIPAPPDFAERRIYIGSNVEILDVVTGDRQIVHRSPASLQAPNWTVDGKALVYNRDGLLYRFDLASGRETVLNTAFANRNNNDHLFSFDGERLAISHHADSGHSQVYVLPAEGGTPRQVTTRGPSYLHGWSPDGRHLVYTGIRGSRIDVYRIPVEGGEELQLTKDAGMNDGPEYSPDGRYIYFNSTRSGTMQLWRMRADGSAPEQLTNDGLNNWFPHLSPDGRWIAFLSYRSDVRPEDHPWYKHVYLRLMPATGGEPRVIAYVYGGQGTINVPSWAPDGRRLAFVSNTIHP